jgi:hypothetical protein
MNDFNIRNDESVYECLWFPNRPRLIINRHGNTSSEEEVKSLNYSTFFDYYKKYIEEIFVEKSKTPHIIVETEGSFPHLRNYTYSKDIIDYLNNKGLTIYLRELPYVGTMPKLKYASGAVIDAGLNSAYETIKRSRSLLTGVNNLEQELICYEFEEIQNFVIKNNLKKVTVVTGHLGIDIAFKSKYSEFKICVEDMCHGMMVRPSKDETFSYVSYNKNLTIPSEDQIEYKFWCSNKSYEAYREIIAGYMLEKSALLSFIHRNFDYSVRVNNTDISINDIDFYWQDINQRLWFDIHELRHIDSKKYVEIMLGLKKLKTIGNLYIDKDPRSFEYNGWLDSNDQIAFDDPIPFTQYSKCFCALVTESLFAYPFGNFGDKVMNAIKCFRPIVLAGAPRSLEFMKIKGLKTFSDYWDESYDQEENHERRLIKILKVVDYINSKSLKELKLMYKDMIPILEYNNKHIASFAS